VVNPQILSGAGLPFSGVVTATALIAAVGSIMMGLVARLPYAVAPGMGLNACYEGDFFFVP
jgi:AGZA family xanthine/uracil permease-like MFS transporter